MIVEGFNTEGVLMMVNISKCKQYYADQAFNYDYPEGLADLITKGIVHIITTDEGIETIIWEFDPSRINLDEWEYKGSYNYLDVAEGDEVRLVSHADFTQMCDHHNGDLEAQIESSLFIRNILNRDHPKDKETILKEECPKIDLPPGKWMVNVYISKDTGDYWYPEFTFHFEKTDLVDWEKITLKPLEFFE
ncbi:hypothetical protein EG346_14865 [Chryseobacterium carnipullorum]|uniref:Uncharacterized protein n=1 Tax=Chryseobacterium carnipullorum TaxID=1124835 RepID=A0A376DTP7_CHRCU|nr:hypothetical protein [Chryseobacterium carnipullorum]AZA49379.1 hypothetical protein EG346_14865 [Chryseobacterium carnipullorum]AZA64267.1 hypothetical protein EG345_05800 [Chryseobacterium carnipullorum]STC94238.1 Uncharacterised protein [Chryseobacterium carnipullorum]